MPCLLATVALTSFLPEVLAAPFTCDDGSRSLPCCSDGSQAPSGAKCPDGSGPTDTCGSCSGAVSSASTSPSGATCTKHATSTGFGVSQPCGSTAFFDGPSFEEPPVAESSEGSLAVTLEVTPGVVDAGWYSFSSRVFKYNGVVAPLGPTLKFKPGDTFSVTLTNSLSADGNDASKAHNTLRLPNTTNIHTHGIHVDPAIDNVYVSVEPGMSHTYSYSIPSDHMPGLHWYHSHQHGASALHLMGGLVGALLVHDDASSQIPPDLKSLTSHVMVITHIAMCSCNPTTDPFRIISFEELASGTGSLLPFDYLKDASNTDIDGGSILLVNGQLQPKLSITVGEWRVFDLVNAVGDAYLELEIRDAINSGITACSMTLLAIDGVYLFSSRTITEFMLSPGGRASIAVMCSNAGTYYFQSYPQERAADNEALVRQNLVTVLATGAGSVSTGPSWTKGSVDRAWYLQDLSSANREGEWELGVEQTAISSPAGAHLGVGTDCTIPCSGRADCEGIGYDDPNQYGSCPHVPFEGYEQGSHYMHVGKLCTVEDVIINGRGKTPHPMHIHVNHFQVISVSDQRYNQFWGEIGDFRDTMPAFVGKTRLRYVLADYGGVIINHCHFLYHEDLGMMSRFWVGDGVTFCVASGTHPRFTYCDDNVPADGWLKSPTTIYRKCTEQEIQAMGLAAPSPDQAPAESLSPVNIPSPAESPSPVSQTNVSPSPVDLPVDSASPGGSPSPAEFPSDSKSPAESPSSADVPSPAEYPSVADHPLPAPAQNNGTASAPSPITAATSTTPTVMPGQASSSTKVAILGVASFVGFVVAAF